MDVLTALLWWLLVLAPLQHPVAPLTDWQPHARDGVMRCLGR